MSEEIAYTLFIIGAGANVPYGFPTGEELKHQICHDFENYYSDIIPHKTEEQKEYYSYNDRIDYYKNEFRKPFLHSPTPSIDLFLSRNPVFQSIGKIAILLCLLEAEKKNLKNGIGLERPDWLEFLFNKMTNTFIEPDHYKFINNRVKFITFNYDRFLESFLIQSIENSFKESLPHSVKIIKGIPIEHVYGKIGLLPWESSVSNDTNVLSYGRDCYFEHIGNLIDNLKLIQDRKIMGNDHLKEMVRNASRIFFLGFAYAPENLEILGLPQNLNDLQKIFGTAYNQTPNEIKNFKSLLNNDPAKRDKENIIIENCDSLMLLRNYLHYI